MENISQLFELRIHDRLSKIYLKSQIDELQNLIAGRKALIITDENVKRLYGHTFPALPVLVLPDGEDTKSLLTLKQIFDFLLINQTDRHAVLIGIGGGVISDLTGLAASLFQRGIAFGFVPTTLLAQVDASVGGKNGINLEGYKNVIGTINQPEFVVIDTGFLHTLPSKEISCGLAEITKHALIADPGMVDYLENNTAEILELADDKINYLIDASIKIKSSFVLNDEKDTGERNKLNFGHTIGHALEKVSGISHGEAVSIGICVAAAISVNRGYLELKEAVRINMLLSGLGLPTVFAEDPQLILEAIYKDKKRKNSYIRFVLLKGYGQPVLENISFKELELAIADLC